MKKRILKIIGIVLVLVIIVFIAIKTYHFMMFNKIYKAVENFRAEENRYYAVEVKQGETINYKEEVILRENVIEYLEYREDDSDLYYEWKNIKTNEQYVVNINEKKIHKDALLLHIEKGLINLPNILFSTQDNIQSKIAKMFEIRSIVPIEYENKKCYKIVTDTETVISDRETYLPLYSSTKVINKEKDENDKIEMKYQFEVGNVTEEDVALPDLTDYTVVE